MLPDYHIHTVLCKHAKGAVTEYRAAAKTLEIPEICFTDHMPSHGGYDVCHRMAISEFESYRAMVTGLQNGATPEVLFGIEADYYEGCEESLGEWLPAQNFDFVLGSVHFIDKWGFDDPSCSHVWGSVDVTATWRKYFKLIERLADSGLFDAVSHLDLPKKFGYRPLDKDLKEMVRPALDRLSKSGVGMELNTSGLHKPVGEIYPSPLILSMARERGVSICFGSDAHCPEDIGRDFHLALESAREAGYTDYFKIRKRVKKRSSLPKSFPKHMGPPSRLRGT